VNYRHASDNMRHVNHYILSPHIVRTVTTLPDMEASSTRPYLPTHRAPRNLLRCREEKKDAAGEEEEEAWQPPLTLGDPAALASPPAPPAPTLTTTRASIAPIAPPTPPSPAPAQTRTDTATSQGQLFRAAAKGDADEVERLLAAGADVNEARSGVTPLHVAAQNGHVVWRCRLTYATHVV